MSGNILTLNDAGVQLITESPRAPLVPSSHLYIECTSVMITATAMQHLLCEGTFLHDLLFTAH